MDSLVQPDAPFGGIAHALVLESRALGWREHPAEYAAMCLDELTAIRSLLKSDDASTQKFGIEAARALRKEQRALLQLELKYAEVGIQAGTYERLSRLRFASESEGDKGPSPENVSAGMATMMAQLMQERKDNGDGGSET